MFKYWFKDHHLSWIRHYFYTFMTLGTILFKLWIIVQWILVKWRTDRLQTDYDAYEPTVQAAQVGSKIGPFFSDMSQQGNFILFYLFSPDKAKICLSGSVDRKLRYTECGLKGSKSYIKPLPMPKNDKNNTLNYLNKQNLRSTKEIHKRSLIRPQVEYAASMWFPWLA